MNKCENYSSIVQYIVSHLLYFQHVQATLTNPIRLMIKKFFGQAKCHGVIKDFLTSLLLELFFFRSQSRINPQNMLIFESNREIGSYLFFDNIQLRKNNKILTTAL